MPADRASYITVFTDKEQDQSKWRKAVECGMAIMLDSAQQDPANRRFILAVPKLHYLKDDAFAAECLPPEQRRALKKRGVVQYEDAEFPGVLVEIHLMTEVKDVGGGKLPVLVIHPSPNLLDLVHQREVSNLVVVPWHEDEIEAWRDKQCPEPIELPEGA